MLTVDHSRCRVQFDRHELGVEFVMVINILTGGLHLFISLRKVGDAFQKTER